MILGHVSAKIDTPVFRLILLMVCIQCTLPHLQVQGFNLQDLFHPLVSAKRFLFPSQMTSELHQSRIVKRSPADPDDNGSLIWECTFPRREILAPRTNGSGTPPLLPPATPSSFQPPDHNLCNFTLDVSRYGLREWSPGSGLESLWMGGPKSDAQGQKTASRYVFYDTSKFYERNEPLQDRAWILSPWTPRSQVKGNCLNFKHASQGLNIGSLNLIRIDLIGLIGKSGGDTAINETSDFPASNPEERTIHELLSDLDLSDAVSQANEQRWARSASLNNYHFRTNLVWSSSDMTNGVWDRVHYSYATPSNHVFAWEVRPDLGGGAGDVRNVFNGYVAIDDIVLKAGECEDECNFNADFCQFSNDEMDDDDFDWSLSRGSLKPGTGPMMDQSATTYGTRTGGYAYLDSGFPRRPGDTARLTHGKAILSPSQRKPLCVSFWVNLYGSGLGSLRVYARPLDHVGPRLDPEFLMWEVDHPPSSPRDVWTQAKFTLANLGNMTKLVFEGVIGEVDRSDIAIDTVQIQPGPCPLFPESAYPLQKEAKGHFSADCTFRLGLCRWKAVNMGRGKPEKIGHHLPLVALSSRDNQDIESAESNPEPEMRRRGAKPGYPRRNEDQFRRKQAGSRDLAQTQEEAMESLWQRVRGGANSVPLGHTKVERGSEDDGDDFLMVFDTRNYHHRPLDSAYLYSEVITGKPMLTSNPATHTEGHPSVQSSNSTLLDQNIGDEDHKAKDQKVGSKCVGFWFQMNGAIATNPYLGSLKVYEVEGNFSNLPTSIMAKTALWSLTNSQGPFWQYGQAPISLRSGVDSRLAFLGIRANTVNGHIAIDDVVVFDGQCQVLPSRALTDPHDCAFDEGNLCGWLAVNPGGTSGEELRPQDWRLADATHTLPNFKDHTFEVENGGFLYFDTANIQILTWLVSGSIIPKREFCFTFWFRSAAVNGAQLSVKRQFKNGTSTLIWRVKHDDLPNASFPEGVSLLPWIPAQVYIGSVSEATLLIVEGSSKERGFALDDLRLLQDEPATKCPTRPDYQSASVSLIRDDLFSRRTSRSYQEGLHSLNLVLSRFETFKLD